MGEVSKINDWNTVATPDHRQVLNAISQPVFSVDAQSRINLANPATENFFGASELVLKRHPINEFVPFDSPLLSLIHQVQLRKMAVSEYDMDLAIVRQQAIKRINVHATLLDEGAENILLTVQELSITSKIDNQLTHRGAARSMVGFASMLAHEIKNPLSGIRGAAQLLESAAADSERPLAELIRDETDRICDLVERFEKFGDDRPLVRDAVNVHQIIERVRKSAQAGFASDIEFKEEYDPSLPMISADKDQLTQAVMNLVKNASESILQTKRSGIIALKTAFRPGIHIRVSGSESKVALPIEISIMDNGGGVPEEVLPHLFDPFVTTKASGSGLGLAMVAKTIGDHGGVIECIPAKNTTVFRILLPKYTD